MRLLKRGYRGIFCNDLKKNDQVMLMMRDGQVELEVKDVKTEEI